MKFSVTKIVRFEMAHQLTDSYTQGCKNIHGHGYKLEVTFSGDIQKDGMIMDFKRMKEIIQPIVDEFDHTFLTHDKFGMNPTAENMANYIFGVIRKKTSLLTKIRLWETENCCAEVGY